MTSQEYESLMIHAEDLIASMRSAHSLARDADQVRAEHGQDSERALLMDGWVKSWYRSARKDLKVIKSIIG